MTMIDSYIAAVGERLHPARRASVEAELRSNILDALEARGASPESEADVMAVLQQLGSPARVAAEYEPRRGFLVGPELFPHMRRAGAIALGVVLAGGTLYYVGGLVLGGLVDFRAGTLLAQTLSVVLRALLGAAVVLVGVFVWLQRSEVRLPAAAREAEWDPRTLRPGAPAPRASRFESATTLVVGVAVLLLLDGVGRTAREVASGADAALQPLGGDVVLAVYALQAAVLLAFAAHLAVLISGRRLGWTRLLRFSADAIALVVFTLAPLRLMQYRADLLAAGASENVVNWLVANAFIFAVVVVAVVAVHLARAWRGRSNERQSDASATFRAVMLLLVFVAAAGCAAGAGTQRAPDANPAAPASRLVSPEIHPDASVTFRVHAPDATEVRLVLETDQGVVISRGDNAGWTNTTAPLAPVQYT
jgi:hypothetical protein